MDCLDIGTRSFFEPRFGHEFSRVRIHTDERAARSAHVLRAEAYTVGNQIVFAAGRYMPASFAGRRLLAHELSHVIQPKRGGTASLLRQATPSVPISKRYWSRRVQQTSGSEPRTQLHHDPRLPNLVRPTEPSYLDARTRGMAYAFSSTQSQSVLYSLTVVR
jgi:hypothetical protein